MFAHFKNVVMGLAISHVIPWLVSAICIGIGVGIAKAKGLFNFLPAYRRAMVNTDLDCIGKLIGQALKKGPKKALVTVVRTALRDGKISKPEVIAIIQAMIDLVMAGFDQETLHSLEARYGDLQKIVGEYVKEAVLQFIGKQLKRIGLKIDPDDTDEQLRGFKQDHKLHIAFYSDKKSGVNEYNFEQEKGVSIPISSSQSISVAVRGDQNWKNRVWKVLWGFHF